MFSLLEVVEEGCVGFGGAADPDGFQGIAAGSEEHAVVGDGVRNWGGEGGVMR